MTITKTSHRASQVLQGARNIRCYSLSNNFSGEALAEKPVIWGEPKPGEHYRPLVEVSQVGFLRHELQSRSTKLSDSGNGHYTIHVHSNLWFSFQSS